MDTEKDKKHVSFTTTPVDSVPSENEARNSTGHGNGLREGNSDNTENNAGNVESSDNEHTPRWRERGWRKPGRKPGTHSGTGNASVGNANGTGITRNNRSGKRSGTAVEESSAVG